MGRLDLDLGRHGRAVEGGIDVAGREPAANEDVLLGMVVQPRCAVGERLLDRAQRLLGVPRDRDLRGVDRGDRPLVADKRQDRLAAVSHQAVGEGRLVLPVRVDPVAVLAGDVGRGEDVDDARMLRPE